MIKKIRFFAAFIFILSFSTFSFAEDAAQKPEENLKKATFAGGCFWCIQASLDKVPGVISTTAGYTGGTEKNPTYEDVSSGLTGHAESVEIIYDPSKITYEKLLEVYWQQIDPTARDRQFVDAGHQYRTAIFYHDEKQKEAALLSKEKLEKSGIYDKPIVTEIVPASDFYPAEDYHQQYYKKSAAHYNTYRFFSGRDQYLDKIWGKNRDKHH